MIAGQLRGARYAEDSLWAAESAKSYSALFNDLSDIEALDDSTITGVRAKRQRYETAIASHAARHAALIADTWCSAFVWPLTTDAPEPPTQAWFSRLERDPDALSPRSRQEAATLADQYRWFHWHLEFPQVFDVPDEVAPEDGPAGWTSGFSVVLGNPPWERIKLQEQEWFAARAPEIAAAPNAAARKRMIKALIEDDPDLHAAYLQDLRRADGESHLLRLSGRYPLCGRGDINTYAVFAETNRTVVDPKGRAGFIVPSGIATDNTTKEFFGALIDSSTLVSLFDFENRRPIFPGVHRSYKFTLLTLAGIDAPVAEADFSFFALDVADLADPERRFPLTAADIRLLNPNTKTCPIFRTRRDAAITKGIYRRVPVLIDENRTDGNPWGISFLRMFDMSNDSHLFRTRQELETEGRSLDGNVFVDPDTGERWLPLYEAKLLHHYDHRWATYTDSGDVRALDLAEKQDPHFLAQTRYWVHESDVRSRLLHRWSHQWLLGWRDICRSTDERTTISAIDGAHASPEGGTLLAFTSHGAAGAAALTAAWNSFAFDFVARQKVGGTHLKYFTMRQLPVPAPTIYGEPAPWARTALLANWLEPRVLELTYTAVDVQPFAADLAYDGPPFRWNPERRFLLRAELDAAFFHVYGIGRDDADYILDTFPIVRRKDEAAHGEYRTKRVILECYDAMASAISTGEPYQTLLDPPPAHDSQRHPADSKARA